MTVTVRIFAGLVDLLGVRSLRMTLPDRATVADVLDELPADDGVIARAGVAVAVNRTYCDVTTPLSDGDEVALIPPVSGGAPGPVAVHGRITGEPLSADRVTDRVRHPSAGAVVTFLGVTRDVPRLEYEAYAEMAGPLLETILREVAEATGVIAIAAEHRVGDVPLGEPSVVIAASAAHREEAFLGARTAIDRVKAELPVWKREHPASGDATWVKGTAVVPPRP